MEAFLFANGVVSLMTAAALTLVILSRRVNEGVLTKIGLIITTLSLYASGAVSFVADEAARGIVNSAFALRVGLLIICAGVAVRFFREGRRL